MEHPAVLLSFDVAGPAAPASSFVGCAFTHALNGGLVGVGVRGLLLQDNVFFRSQGTAVDLDAAVGHGAARVPVRPGRAVVVGKAPRCSTCFPAVCGFLRALG